MAMWLRDFQFALRVLARRPGATLVILLALTLGIGGNTAIFSIINGLFLRPLPFPEPDRLVEAERGFPEGPVPYVAPPKFLYWKQSCKSFEALAGWESLDTGFNLSGAGRPERLSGSRVTADFFKVFGTQMALGRGFEPGDDRPGAQPVAVLSQELWRGRFGQDPAILGRTLTLNKVPHVVVGVAPGGFRVPETAQLWIPARVDPADQSQGNTFFVTGRLRPGVSMASAQAEIRGVGRRYLATGVSSETDSPEQVRLRPLQEFLYGDLRPALLIMLAAVGLVLLIACANVANLQLARAMARKEEIFIRTALGASAGNIVRQLLVESMVLSLAGGLLGLALCSVALRPLLALSPMAVPRLADVGLDTGVLLFTLVVSLLTGILFGSLPSVHARRLSFGSELRSGSFRTTGEARAGRVRTALVGSQVALAVILTIGALLLLRDFFALSNVDPGFRPEGVLTAKMALGEQYMQPEALETLGRRLLPELSGLPGVAGAGLVTSLPLEAGSEMPFTIIGRDTTSPSGVGQARYLAVNGDYYEALGIPLKSGRLLTGADRQGSELVVVINEAARRKFWPDENPLDKQIHLGLPSIPDLADPTPRRIVGVVGDVREVGLNQPPPPAIYVPMGQMPPLLAGILVKSLPINLVVRSGLPPGSLMTQVQQKVWSLDPEQPLAEVATMDELLSRSLGSQQFNMLLLAILAGMALILSAIGIYGMLAYVVSQRTREIGIRMALGADRGQILGLMVRGLMKVVVIGSLIGLVSALGLTRFLASLLSGMGPAHWTVFFLVPAFFLLVALLAAVIPTRRATQVNPSEVLNM